MRTQLLLIRHGQTASNDAMPDPRMSGWTDLPLTAAGEQQAKALGRRFRSEPVDAIYSSPLRRARDTALEIARGPLQVLDELREIYCGVVDGWPLSKMKQCYPDLWEANFRQGDEKFRWPGGESYLELRQRSLSVMEQISTDNRGARVVVITHAGVISQLIGALHGLSPARWADYRPGNASLSELEWGPHRRVISYDDRAHLQEYMPHS